ncbi:MAG: hypothetical protein WD341_14865 [Tistlia sp.]|uniref:hypothetical protein n=1 Tax=Tistlia sp. TaxID=3057121 RepID=UPI0034A1C4AC
MAGGLVGAVAEAQLSRAGAKEFVVRQDNGQTIAVVQIDDEGLAVGDRVLILRSNKVRLIGDGSYRKHG